MSSNCMVFHTSGVISSSPVVFLFLIFPRTESSSSRVNGSCVTFGGFPSRFSKCCFHIFILFC